MKRYIYVRKAELEDQDGFAFDERTDALADELRFNCEASRLLAEPD